MSTIITFILVLVACWSVLAAYAVSVHRAEQAAGKVHPRNTIGHAVRDRSKGAGR